MNIRPYLQARPQLGQRVYVDSTAVVIGRVWLGDDVSVWPTTVIRGDVNDIRIGARTNVQDGSMLHCASASPGFPQGLVTDIGTDVTVGHHAILHACTVGNFCLIGMGAIVLDGAVIEDEVFVGAGAMVTPGKRLTARGLYIGSPARRARDLSAEEIAAMHHSAAHYVQVKNNYL